MSTSTLILTIDGPMQYWAAAAGPRQKRTHDHPTKSATVGLIANALGRDYTDSIDDLAALSFAAVTVRPGTIELDYKTAGTVTYPALPGDLIAGIKLDGRDVSGQAQIASTARKNPNWTTETKGSAGVAKADYADGRQVWEEYLADAAFRIGLTGDTTLLTEIHRALAAPARAVYFGRRAYSPTRPLVDPDSLYSGDLEDNMATFDTGSTLWTEVRPGTPGSHLVDDQPVTYAHGGRRRKRAEIIRPATSPKTDAQTGHDTGSDSPNVDFFATALE